MIPRTTRAVKTRPYTSADSPIGWVKPRPYMSADSPTGRVKTRPYPGP